ncbi:hypothetical protein PHSC3_000884 [Chlamydiales bacterium STE3]|nr:hypothetical protein PHSC3_000884 [Chlamydiales bacterium STE3]
MSSASLSRLASSLSDYSNGPKRSFIDLYNIVSRSKDDKPEITSIPWELPRIDSGLFIKNLKTKKSHSCAKVLKKTRNFILSGDALSWVNTIGGEARAVYGLVTPYFGTLIRASKAFAATELTRIFSLPFDAQNLVMSCHDFFANQGEAKIDAYLGVLGGISDVGDAASTLATVFVELGALGASAMSWATPLSVGCTILSSVSILMNARSLYFSSKTVKKLDKYLKPNTPETPDYKGACRVLKKQNYFLENHCSVDTKLLQKKITSVYNARRPSEYNGDKAGYNKRMDQIFEALKTRIQYKQFSSVLSILTTKLGLIATALFLFSPLFAPLAISGLGILTILFAINLFKMGFDLYADTRFHKKIKVITP